MTDEQQSSYSPYLGKEFSDSELIIGLVAAVGTDLDAVEKVFEERLRTYKYTPVTVRVSESVIPLLVDVRPASDGFAQTTEKMNAGNFAREMTGDNAVLALGVAAEIALHRQKSDGQPQPRARAAYIVRSLKHPEEVARLREIYPEGFFLIGVHSLHVGKRKRDVPGIFT